MLKNSQVVLTVPVKEMERAVEFYSKVLGLEIEMRAPGDFRNTWTSVKGGVNTSLWLNPGKWQVTFLVGDIYGEVDALKRKGVKFRPIPDHPRIQKETEEIARVPWGWMAFFQDTEDNDIMLFEQE